MIPIPETSKIVDCTCDSTCRIWNHVACKNSILGKNVSIGDFSQINNSVLSDWVNIQRNNAIFSSTINRYTYTGRNLNCWNSNIGSFCSISWNVTIGAGDHDYKKITTSAFLYSDIFDIKGLNNSFTNDKRICSIGNDVWIGCGAVIRRNVSIGDGAIIGSNAVVTKNVEPFSIVVGSPAKHIKYRFDREIIKELLEIKWWDLPINIIKENFKLFGSHPNKETLDILKRIRNKKEY